MHRSVQERVVFPTGVRANEPTKFSELGSANCAELLLDALCYFIGVDNPEIGFAIYPHLDERHWVVALRFEMC
jgi:hypothetical protein